MTTENTVSSTLITGTADNDSIINFGDDVTIDSGSGNDTIYSGLDDRKADRVSINAGAGDNVVSIQGGSDSVTIRTGDGNNLIGSTSPNNAVFTGSGNDSVVFYTGSDNNTVETGDGDDVIQAVGHNVTIDTGSGNDRIRTFRNAYDITIKAGTGDDDITLGGPVDTDHTNVVQYADGDGNDSISTFSATDTLQITSGSISGASLVGNDVVITVGSGKITLVEANDMNINIIDANGILHQTIFSGGSSDDTVVNDTLIVGTDGDDYLINDKGKNVTINGYAGNDTIDNTGDNSIIDAGAGNDIVSVAGASNVTIRTGDGDNRVYTDNNGANELVYFGNGKNTIVTSNRHSTILGGSGGNSLTLHNGSFGSSVRAGSGNDTVQVGHYDITVDAGNGNDLISLYRDAENAFIIPGAGNDTITVYNNTHSQTFQYSGGNDLINGFKANDTLKIVGATSANTIVNDGNLIFDFGDGSLTLAGVSSVESLNVEYLSKWTTIDGGGWAFNSVAQRDFSGYYRDDKAAQFSISGGNLKDEDGDGAPDNVSIGSIIYVPQSGVHTNVRNLSGNVIYNGDALGVEGDDSYNIEAVSPIDLSETFAGTYITNPHVTAMRLISDGATISPRGDAGTGTVPADWYSFDNAGGTVTFMDGSYCVYTENKFSTRNYTKLTIENSNLPDITDVSGETTGKAINPIYETTGKAINPIYETTGKAINPIYETTGKVINSNNGVEVTTADDLIQKIGNLADGYEITIESGINVGERINFETSGDGVIVVKTTANTGKYSLDADSDEWQYQRYSIYGGDNFNFVFGDNGSVVGMENFDGTLTTNDTTLSKGEWVTLEGGKFQYTGNATNNPSKSATFTVSGESITSTDNLSVNRIMYIPAQDACRVELNGISGNATIDDVELGISGDSNYSAHFSKINDRSPINIVLMDVSDGATVDSNYTAGVDNNGLIKFSDGKHSVLTSDNPQGKVTSIEASNGGNGFEINVSDGIFGTIGGLNDGYAVTINAGDNIGDELTFQTDGGNGTIAIADETLSAGGENDFTVEFDDEGKIIFGRWSTIDGGFVYSGHASNNYAKTADVSLIGSELKDTDGDGAPDNISVNAFNYSSITGVMAFMSGFSGEVTLNNKDVGVIGDDDYEVHFTAKVIENAPANVIAYTNTKEVRGISNGATVNPNESDMVGFDSNAKAHVGDVTKFLLYNKNHKGGGSPHATIGIDNNGAGADLTVKNDILTKIDGLNDGYSATLVASDNVSDNLKFNDVGSGNFELTSLLDDTVQASFKGTSSAQTITGSGNSVKLIGSSGDDLLIAGATHTTLTGGKGSDTFRGGASLETALITDYTEGEDVIYHGRAFSDLSINGYISGKDYVFDVAQAGRTITVKDGANKVIKVVDVNGEERLFGKYLTLDDNDPATVTAQDGVATIDAVLRTKDIVINGNSGDNTIISSSGDCTLFGGKGKDTFVRGSRTAEQTIVIADYTEGEDVIYHSRPFAAFSLLDGTKSVGDDYISEAGTATFKYLDGANKKIKFVDVNGDVAYFGNYLTILDVDSATVTASEKVKVLDATERTKGVKLTGNALDNTIYSGKGNSTLTGGDGSDLFVYNGGNDIITDYTEGDKISLGAAVSSSYISGAAAVLTTDAGTLTIQNADGKTLSLIDSAGKEFSINASSATEIINDVTEQASRVESVAADSTGTENITLNGGEAAIISKTSANVNITASAGNDTIISQGENVHVSLTGGNTRIFPLEGRMTLENYDATTGAGFGTTYTNIFSAVEDGSIDFNNGRLKLGSARVYMGNSSELMNFYLSDGQQQKAGFTGSDDTLDTSKERDDFLLKGNKRSTITAGSGNDTILVGSRNVVDAGDGRNQIYLAQDRDSTIVMSGKGRNTVHGFNTGYAGDCVKVDDFTAVKFKFDTNGMRLTSNDARLNFDGIGLTTADSGEKILLADNTKTIRTVVAQDNQTIIVDEEAEAFFGKRSGLNFSDYDEDVNINLSDGTGKLGNLDATFSGFNKLQAGDGMSTLIGDSGRNTLIAGTGYTSMWGGAGNDKLIGKGNSADKDGSTTFFFFAGDGRDVISDFTFLTPENRYDGIDDKINVGDSDINNAYRSGNNVVVEFDQDSYLILEDAVGKDFRIADMIAKVDRNITYDGLANCYVASGGSSLTVDSTVESAEIWLDNSHGTQFFGNIRTLDASAVEGNTSLVGNEFDNTILAGHGDSSLWGGFTASDDVLIGGDSRNTFFYCNGNGRDTIQGINDGDAMILSDISLDQIISTNISADAVSINFIDGGSLQINGSADVTYQLADGSKYSANRTTLDWDSK